MTIVTGSLGGLCPDGGPRALVEPPPGELAAALPDDASLASVYGDTDRVGRRRTVSHAYRRAGLGMAASDAACAVVSLMGAVVIQYGWRSVPAALYVLVALTPLAWVAIFASFHLYHVQTLSAWDEFRSVVGATSVGVSAIMVGSLWVDSRGVRASLALMWLFALVLELSTRRLWRRRLGRLRGENRLAYRTLVVGTNDEAARLSQRLGGPGTGFQPLGYVAASGPVGTANGAPVLGGLSELERLIDQHSVECLFVAVTSVSSDDMVHLSRVARQEDVQVKVSANLPQTLTSRVSVQAVGDVLSLSVKPVRLTRGQAAVKRLSDVVIASVALVASLPLIALLSAAVRLTSRGPVLFRQERLTKGGKRFQIYKFRTMRQDADSKGLTPVGDLSAPFFKQHNDPRLTKVGRIIRRYSLDELPQLWNVLRGDISLVGPRPLWSIQVDPESDVFSRRHEVRTGLTGWWQINGRSGVEADEALRMDLFYIENWSLGLDFYIMLQTVGVVLRSRGAC